MGKAEQSLDDMLKKQNMANSKMDSTGDNTIYYLKHQCKKQNHIVFVIHSSIY